MRTSTTTSRTEAHPKSWEEIVAEEKEFYAELERGELETQARAMERGWKYLQRKGKIPKDKPCPFKDGKRVDGQEE